MSISCARPMIVIASLGVFWALSGPTASAAVNGPACSAAARYSAEHGGLSFLVLKGGKPICEDYPNGGSVDRGNPIASGTKSFSGVMAAAAAQDGLLSLDEPAAKTLTEWASDPLKAKVTLRQLLSLSSGLKQVPTGAPPSYAQAVGLPMTHEPGAVFEYSPAPYQVFGEIMKRKLKAAGRSEDPLAYLQARVFDPIGLKLTGWGRTDGDPNLPSSAVLSAREWAKFGEFVRAKGVVGGKRIVDAATLQALFKGSRANPGYGVTWWLPGKAGIIGSGGNGIDDNSQGLIPEETLMAAGAGNQRLYIVPSKGLTIVRQQAIIPRAQRREQVRAAGQTKKWSDAQFIELVLKPM